jgi:hypothetical protein
MESPAKDAMRSGVERKGWLSSDEWWAVFGTVAGAFEGFGFVGFDADSGKCFFLYVWSTLESS